jgi:hypothetical protein
VVYIINLKFMKNMSKNMSKNKIAVSVVISILVVGLVFYGGMKYGQSSSKTQIGAGNFGQRLGQMGSGTQKTGHQPLGGMVSGQILSIDTNSFTIKSQDGGSRIVFLSASTTVNKMAEGSVKDLAVGSSISVNGASNPDNSINAQSIQIRPQMPAQIPVR